MESIINDTRDTVEVWWFDANGKHCHKQMLKRDGNVGPVKWGLQDLLHKVCVRPEPQIAGPQKRMNSRTWTMMTRQPDRLPGMEMMSSGSEKSKPICVEINGKPGTHRTLAVSTVLKIGTTQTRNR